MRQVHFVLDSLVPDVEMRVVGGQVAFHASAALRQYFRTHLVLQVAALKRQYCGHNAVKQVRETAQASWEAVDSVRDDSEQIMHQITAPNHTYLLRRLPS